MSDAAKKSLQSWATVLLAIVLAMLGGAKIAGANETRVEDHERRLQILETKFERALENQANMAGDIRVIRAIIEQQADRK